MSSVLGQPPVGVVRVSVRLVAVHVADPLGLHVLVPLLGVPVTLSGPGPVIGGSPSVVRAGWPT